MCEVVALPSDEGSVTIYFDDEASKATTEAVTRKDKELNNVLTTIFLDWLLIKYPVQRVLGRLDMSAVYVTNLYV